MRTFSREVGRGRRLLSGRVSGATGAIISGSAEFRCTRTSAGNYNIQILRPYRYIESVTANPYNTPGEAPVFVTDGSLVAVLMRNSSGVAADIDFNFTIVGVM